MKKSKEYHFSDNDGKKENNRYFIVGFILMIALMSAAVLAWSPWITEEKAIQITKQQIVFDYPDPEPPKGEICSFCRETEDEVYKKSNACNGCFTTEVEWHYSTEQKYFGKEVTAKRSSDDTSKIPPIETKYFINYKGELTRITE